MPILVNIDQIKEGMELFLPISNKFNQMLLPVGTKLNENHKQLLKTWGIQSIQVKEEACETSAWEFDKSKSLKAKEALEKRMTWAPRNLIEEGLYKMALLKLLEKEL